MNKLLLLTICLILQSCAAIAQQQVSTTKPVTTVLQPAPIAPTVIDTSDPSKKFVIACPDGYELGIHYYDRNANTVGCTVKPNMYPSCMALIHFTNLEVQCLKVVSTI